VNDFVLAYMKQKQIPGVSLAVIHEGEILKIEGYGLANVELGVPRETPVGLPREIVGQNLHSGWHNDFGERGKDWVGRQDRQILSRVA
jgi:hypothetical protein